MSYYFEISRVVTMIASTTMTLGLYAQCLKLFRTKSAKDFTLSLVASLVFTEIVWLNYGLVLAEWPIILSSVLNLFPVMLILVGYSRYRLVRSEG
jgi:MtN3 and saliva related transmembrane protein